jgi:hypothetical protein
LLAAAAAAAADPDNHPVQPSAALRRSARMGDDRDSMTAEGKKGRKGGREGGREREGGDRDSMTAEGRGQRRET